MLRIDHLGVAASDLDAALRFYRDLLGLDLVRIEEVASQGTLTHHFQVGESRIEVLTPTDPEGPIARFLQRNGPGLHHVALEVEDLDAMRERLVAAGMQPIGEPSIGAHGKRIQFFHPKTTGGVLLEICTPGGARDTADG